MRMTALPLDVARIFLEPAVEAHARGREILHRFPDAERIPVISHWQIPELRDGDPGDYLAAKRQSLVLGVKKGLSFRPNGRSADFIAPSSSNGCAMACAYCYVARRKGHANPISVFVNIEAIMAATARHAAKQGPKPVPNQVDPEALGVRPRRERRPVGGRRHLRQRARPRGAVPHPAGREGQLRDEVGEPGPPRL
jgi:hypothetical protein